MKVPGTDAVAFSCVAPRGVPYGMAAGVGQVMVDVAWVNCSELLAEAAP